MSDRSFGDYANRNVVKNPLLSTAVTGLSIEDLTQNAVLLPAVPSQETSTRQDQQHGSQMRTLWHSEHDITNFPSGDTKSNQTQQQNTQTNAANPINNNKNTQNDKINEMTTVSKASFKSTDDFDVNEYFARLQGTRYVSAPLNSNVTDQNANLQAEENLEEINLNDSTEQDKVQGSESIQNSLTADIAQNFSQLPNVLPHVASAVFSSFSNMLNLKSREVTPDETKVQHEVQQRAVNVPLGVPEAPVSVAPPPLREPPMTGTTSNFRIATKKKVYAQVPGLSSGDHQHNIQTFNPGSISQNAPSYFIPDADVTSVDHSKFENAPLGFDAKSSIKDQTGEGYDYNSSLVTDGSDTKNIHKHTLMGAEKTQEKKYLFDPSAFVPISTDGQRYDANVTGQVETGPGSVSTEITSQESKETSNVQFNPSASVPKPTCQTRFDAKIFDKTSNTNTENGGTKDRSYLFNPAAAVDKPTEKAVEVHSSLHSESIIDFGTPMKIPTESSSGLSSQMKPNTIAINQNRQEPSQTYIHNPATEFMPLTPQGSSTVIPPPPMFSNIPRRDSQKTMGKSVLPPSVARRISANQPIIKPQPKLTMVPQENIFIPTIPIEPETRTQPNYSLFEYTPNNTNMGQCLTTDKSENSKQTQINLQAQTFSANNQQPLIQIPLHSFNQPLNSSNSSAPVVSSSNTVLPVLPACESLNSKESSSWPLATSVPLIAKEASSKEILFSSQRPKTIQPTGPSFSSDTVIKSEQKSSTERYLQTTDISVPLNTEQANIAPPMFFNPATLNQVSKPKEETQNNQDAANKQFPLFMTSALPEPPKDIPEPPKMTGNLNYRLTRKKPQYYSGPIEGVGNISNNVKPVMNPTGPSSFQGAVFTPEQNVQSFMNNSATDYSLPCANIVSRQIDLPKPPTGPSLFQGAILTPDQNVQPITQTLATEYSSSSACESAPPFDLNKAAATSYQAAATSYATFDVNEPQERKPVVYNDFNTAFDLSRPTTDKYEDTLQESKGFGIIGSLKSKLSSIDINKIQNTVTTFFDPAYNNTKCEEKKHESLSQDDNNLSIGNHQKFPQLESPNLGVFVHDVHAQKNPTFYNYSTDYSQPAIQPEDHKMQEYINQLQNYPYPRWSDEYGQPNAYSDYAIRSATQGRHRNETKPFIEAEKLCTDTALFTHIRNTALEKENENVVNISKITDPLPLDALVHQELNRNQEQILSDTRFKDNTEEISDLSGNKKKSEISQNTGESSKSFFERDFKQEQQSCFDDPFTNAFDLGELKTTSSLVQKLPRETSRVLSNISAKDFFNRQQSKEALITNKTGIGFELLQKSTNPVLNFSDNNAISSNKGSQSIFNTQSIADVDTSKELLTTVILPVLKDVSEDLVPPQYLDVNRNDQNASSNFENQIDAGSKALNLSQPENTLLNICKINTMADCTSYKDIKNIEEKMENVALTENNENILKHKSLVSDSFEKSDNIDFKEDFLNEQVSELNICETCREVNKPEEKDADDLTTQLIENITAPIQLANPVEYAFVGSTLVTDKSEISHITEGIIETMKLPPPVELIDDISVSTNINFGWSINETHLSKVLQEHHQLVLLSSHPGFCQDKTLIFENIPTNASDEIKAEYRFPQEDALILPPPINIPTAPPEEDTKSDESGLDVHSIEQDAKKDFPIYEDFVIEPSETDDDKIEYKERERSSDDPIPDADTFTNRVERYKKMETNPETCELLFGSKEDSLPFELPTSTSPALTIASYFDTGNYAVENHYRNSLSYPPTLSSFTVNASMCIPPGFEDEYKRRLSDIAASRVIPALDENNTFIPDTSTNTPTTVTLTVNNPNLTYVPDTSTQTRSLAHLTYSQSPVESLNISDAEVKTMIEKIVEDSSSPALAESELSSFVEPKKETSEQNKPDTSTKKEPQKVEEPKSQSLPDPINFFSSNADSTDDSDVYNNFSRLSSYFASPPKPDHTKSFFELSQSQDHYRHKPKNDTFDSIQNNVKSFFETTSLNTKTNSSIDDANNKNTNIPQINVTNMNLVHDLTSYKNFTPNEDVVKTVNYFTVKYDVEHAKESNIGEPKVSAHLGEKTLVENTNKNYTKEHKNNQLGDDDSLNFEDIINQCKYCCDTTKKFIKLDVNSVDFDNFNVRRAMDRNADTRKEGDGNMAQGKDSVTKKSMSVNFLDQTFQDDSSDKIVSVTEHRTCSDYAPVKYHWFYQIELEDKTMWRGFSAGDSKALEDAYNSPDLKEDTVVATDGGRYDVNVMRRTRSAVYWTDKPTNVMRCSWFYKSTAVPRYVPYTETIAEKLEDMYRHSVTTGEWHRRLMLPNDEMVVMHGPSVMVHFLQASTDGFTATPQSMRQRVVRGCVESEIEDTEPSSIDHLLLMCHGVGSACDMRFRSVEEVVDDFRSTSLQLVQSHYRNSYDSGLVGRVEVLPISWHSSLHSGENGVDTRLAAVTLDSIPRLRNFTNDTLLDVLFYTSPVFCQTIIDTVCSELNRIYALFKKRNPDYEGGVSLGGHSLGSVILYDLLCHQEAKDAARPVCTDKQYVVGTAGTGQPSVRYPRLGFQPDALYALGSPIAIFECIRGVQTLGRDFCLPTCKNFFNIFHPYDPIAYRIEPMINPQLRDVKPSLIPHHKGRKRMHLELKDTMARVGADIKQKVIESIKSTWSSMWKTQPPPDTQLEKVVEEEIEREALNSESKDDQVEEHEITAEMLGKLNGGRRVDHVLQEAPFEMINEYLFAMSSHVCYWESEDTMLVMLREIYNAIGVTPDCCVPQRTMTVQRTRPQEESNTLASPESPSTSRG